MDRISRNSRPEFRGSIGIISSTRVLRFAANEELGLREKSLVLMAKRLEMKYAFEIFSETFVSL